MKNIVYTIQNISRHILLFEIFLSPNFLLYNYLNIIVMIYRISCRKRRLQDLRFYLSDTTARHSCCAHEKRVAARERERERGRAVKVKNDAEKEGMEVHLSNKWTRACVHGTGELSYKSFRPS